MTRALFGLLTLLAIGSADPDAIQRPEAAATTVIAADDLYARALIATLEKVSVEWGGTDDSASGECVRTDYHDMIMHVREGVSDKLPSDFGGFHVNYLDYEQMVSRYRRVGKRYRYMEMWPIKLKIDRLSVYIGMPYFSYEKRMVHIGISDWNTVYFRYDCDAKAFVLDEVVLGRI